MAWCWHLPIHWNGITKECCKACWFIGKTKDLWIPCWFESGARSGKESNPWKSSPSFIEWSVFPLCVVKNPEFVLWWNHHIMIILLSMWLWRTIQTQTKEEKKDTRWCDYCKSPKHTRETCWRLNGRPQ